MLGTFRWVLASMVVVTHLWPSQTGWWGTYAVFSFFLVSGYLMTLVLDRTYPYTADGLSRYTANRALRIYPPYLAVCAIALILIHLLPAVALETNVKMRWPNTPERWAANLFIFGTLGDNLALVPPAWSLNIELVFYVAMGALLSRNRIVIGLWFVASVAHTAYWVAVDPVAIHPRYDTLVGASLPFSLGAVLYAYRRQFEWIRSGFAPVAAVLFLGNVWLAVYRPLGSALVFHYYFSLFFAAILLVALTRLRPSQVPGWYARLDRLAGDLSYPIFLCHFHVAVVVVWLGFDGVFPKDSAAFFGVCLVLANFLAYAIHRSIDVNVDALRDRVRRRKATR